MSCIRRKNGTAEVVKFNKILLLTGIVGEILKRRRCSLRNNNNIKKFLFYVTKMAMTIFLTGVPRSSKCSIDKKKKVVFDKLCNIYNTSMSKATKGVQKCARTCIQQDGGHIENLLKK